MGKRKRSNINWPRYIIQWGVILALLVAGGIGYFNLHYTPDFEAYCPFGGLQALGSYLLNNSLACTMTSTQIVMGVLFIVGVFLFSKLFCSYICPIGTVSEWLGSIGDKLKIRYTIKGIADKLLRALKYVLLFLTVYFTLGSNELFCKEYDPFYALASGFGTDVVVLYAVIAIGIVVLGSVFIRLFWCKYLCPLGALSNIFKFMGFFLAVLLVYLGLLWAGVEISYVWPLAVASGGGYLIELLGMRSRLFPVAVITRNVNTCTNCQLCSIECPQGIDVASVETVKHVDCNLCGDCVSACPEKDTIQINKRTYLKWLPPVAVVVLFILGLLLESVWEIPTIEQKWAPKEKMDHAAIFSRAGLKNIKCYGSSMAFANKMRRVKGVYGVATYVGDHKVKIFYDPDLLTQEELEKKLFTPSKAPLRPLAKGVTEVTEVTVLLDNFFDTYDFNYLARLLQQKTKAVGLLSEYACPVIVKIYFPGGTDINDKELTRILESKSLAWESGGKSHEVLLNYKVAGKIEKKTIPRGAYISLMFSPYKASFNDYGQYDSSVVKVFVIPLGKNAGLRKRFPYLVSHLSNDPGIIKFETALDSNYRQVLEISFVDSLTNPQEIVNLLNSDTLRFTYSSGKTGKARNFFHFGKEEKIK